MTPEIFLQIMRKRRERLTLFPPWLKVDTYNQSIRDSALMTTISYVRFFSLRHYPSWKTDIHCLRDVFINGARVGRVGYAITGEVLFRINYRNNHVFIRIPPDLMTLRSDVYYTRFGTKCCICDDCKLPIWTPCGHCYCLTCYKHQYETKPSNRAANPDCNSWDMPCAVCRKPVSKYCAICEKSVDVVIAFYPDAAIHSFSSSSDGWIHASSEDLEFLGLWS